jgi:hypothetical protein
LTKNPEALQGDEKSVEKLGDASGNDEEGSEEEGDGEDD